MTMYWRIVTRDNNRLKQEEDMLIDYALIIGTGIVIGELLTEPIYKKINKFTKKELSETTLVLGRDKHKNSITVDMAIDSHILIVGLSNCGKSRMAEYSLKDKNVIIINAFDEDFGTLKAPRINGEDSIIEYLTNVLKNRTPNSEPLFLLIDELVVLLKNKQIAKLLQDLLCIARHYQTFIVALSQEGTKEVVNCKHLFNVRVMMKALEDSTFRTVLGASVENTNLKQREFYVRDNNGIRFGKTYDI